VRAGIISSRAMGKRTMDYRILGSFEVRADDRLVGLGGEKPRALLAILLLQRNQVVSADRLIDGLWGESPPASAPQTLRAYVSRLRKALNVNGSVPAAAGEPASGSADGVLLTQGSGYVLRVAPEELDVERFRELAVCRAFAIGLQHRGLTMPDGIQPRNTQTGDQSCDHAVHDPLIPLPRGAGHSS
jgi:hypothetical protein